jgi:hypothetical protein
MDPDPDADRDPVIFVSDLRDVKEKLFYSKFFCLLLFEVHLHNFSKIKSHKGVTKQEESRFLCLSMSMIRMRIREAQKVDPGPQHCFVERKTINRPFYWELCKS